MSTIQLSTPPEHLLFIYGTLLAGDEGQMGRAQRQRLGREANIWGDASTRGRLYDLGRYPGLVLDGGPDDLVHGQLAHLAMPIQTLAWLDAYEGIVPGVHPYSEYERRVVDVLLDDGTALRAWAYVYCRSIIGKPLIASGRWLARDD